MINTQSLTLCIQTIAKIIYTHAHTNGHYNNNHILSYG